MVMGNQFAPLYRSPVCPSGVIGEPKDDILFRNQLQMTCELCNRAHNFNFERSYIIINDKSLEGLKTYANERGFKFLPTLEDN